MVLLSIGYASGKCDIYERLAEMSCYFKENGVSIGLVESDSEDMHFIKCVIKDEDRISVNIPDIKNSFDIYASNIIYSALIDNFLYDIILKVVKENYSYFNEEEYEDIVGRCMDILKGTAKFLGADFCQYISFKDRIVKKIFDYIIDNTDIILEGFLRFRLKELNNELEDLVDKVVEEYLVEREYNEFIKLLKYFVEIQESRIDIVNVVIKNDGNYCIYDGDSNDITDELLKDMFNDSISGEVNYDDLLVSSLITAAPRFIVIHNLSNVKNKEIIETIGNVFCERVRICQGCSLCKGKSPAHKL